MKSIYHLIFIVLCIISSFTLHADNLRQMSSNEGLSNSSVVCILQDSRRFLWIGTYDGLNMYDGRDIHVYKPEINNPNSLSSNVIRGIVETDNNYLWIITKWGLNKFSKRNNIVEEFYKEFKDDAYSVKDSHDNLFVLGKQGVLSLYRKSEKRFIDLPVHSEITCERVGNVSIDSQDVIWINHAGVLERYAVSSEDSLNPQIKRLPDYAHPRAVDYLLNSSKGLIIIDAEGNLYTVTPEKQTFLKNISPLMREYGIISSAIFDGDDLLIGFKTNGLVRLLSQSNYRTEKIDINCGVFALKKDEKQDIVWIGTDGQGVYAWTKDDCTFRNLSLTHLPVVKQRPIRAIYTDSKNSLWLGTKDNGVIKIENYNAGRNGNVTHYTTDNGLNNNEVFALAMNRRHDILWIGSNGPGLNYYSFHTKKIHSLINPTPNAIKDVHALLPDTRDSLLWVGAGSTLLKVHVRNRQNQLIAEYTRPFVFDVKNRQIYNQIYSLCRESDTVIWVGIRGNGIVRFNTESEEYRFISFDEQNIAPMNDVLCIHRDKNNTLWLGTSYGITRFNIHPDGSYEYKNFNENDGLTNNTIHGILEDSGGRLWLSSNAGIILFDPRKNTFRNFNRKTGLKIVEFSDNAYYKDDSTRTCFFGGVDGLVWIEDKQREKKQAFIPDIFFTKLRIFNKDYHINDFEKRKDDERYIELNYKQNFFAISFVATDFINGENSRYSYKLDNFSNVWMDTRSNEAQFTNIPPGSYTLRVKYNDEMGDSENRIQHIRIVILPPWYRSVFAKIVYLVLSLACILLIYYYIRKKNESRKTQIAHQLQEKYKEEMYEGKLRFFTNITHEFCTPLTLIYGPCERILDHEESDAYVKKYAKIIKSNTERLNSLIQEIIDFRRMETGNGKCHIQALNADKLIVELTDSFNELAGQNHISFRTRIEPDIEWNTDYGCFTKIINNLVSNAFKYTPPGGEIQVSMEIKNEVLHLSVYNTGKGIRKEDIPRIFNRYSVLDNIKENAIKGLSSRNGLGLAICYSMVELLQGKIEVESEVNNYARFIVSLPYLELTENVVDSSSPLQEPPKSPFLKEEILTDTNNEPEDILVDRNKARILAIDDNKDVLWMIKEILSDEYVVTTAGNGEKGLQLLKQSTPDLIITDIMMPNLDGISLTKQLKQNRHTMHIPLIILSAKNTADEKIEGIESGADAYVAKPFDAHYLKTVVNRLIKSRRNMEEYYNTSASAYDFSKGQLIETEKRDFLQSAINTIDKNIDNSEFLPENLAASLQISLRNLYRKFKELNQPAPKDFIKERRMSHAAKLLRTTTLTIQEIMYKTGFTNRSHFYKEFFKRYNLTPKEYRKENKVKDLSLE
jgi:signal transduction histidine kinase/ligand-binding sensor domain-containing protein/DNA-binding response OmpR family regulator